MFLTSTRHSPNFGGRTGGDAICQTAADTAGLDGTFQAFLASGEEAPAVRFSAWSGWYRTDGLPFANSLSTAVAGDIFYPPLLDENGDQTSHLEPWTGNTSDNCNDWTDTTGIYQAKRSRVDSTLEWDMWGPSVSCSGTRPLLCFETGVNQDVSPADPGVRLAFRSSTSIGGGAGLTAMDDLCQSEFDTEFGTGSGRVFRAFVAEGTNSAADRITDQSSSTWSRTDGVLLAETPAEFLSGDWLAQISRAVDGDHSLGGVWTGSNGPDAAATNDCQGWTSSSDTDTANRVNARFMWAYGNSTSGCDISIFIYCVED